ncbi:FecR protein [Botrimarina colliarenosi]|uniref:FecR protein n=1 Tax=Botrimarina colliarenosi TaxID=2528001 RepID=A0A5C6AEZ0_9BACT|nr:FecR domain-containing protein [Botrimarina colliarenosi]TWT97755.1 FecR protein [Botrimarina colliarenosi]
MPQDQPLHDLVDALSDRSINDEQITELNRRLETDPDCRRGYLNLMRIEAELGALHQPLASLSFDDGTALVDQARRPPAPKSAFSHTNRSTRFLQMMGALAASVAITAVCSSWITYEGVKGKGPLASLLTDPHSDSSAPTTVARVAATRNCRWSGDSSELGFGADVTGGQLLELETGFAELTFAGGARVVLEGPAAFRIADADTIQLYSGRIAAAIPTETVGFSVRTPRLVIAESGAQYGVVAGLHGADEVHVFEGAVEAKAVDGQGHVMGVVNLASLEAARFRTTNHRFARLAADDEGFVRSLETRTGPGEGLLAFDNFAYPTGPVAWQNGGFGWVGPWADLEASPSEMSGAAPSNGVVRGSITAGDLVALGNRFVQSGNANRVRRVLSTSLGGVFDAAGLVENIDGLRLIGRNSSTVYISFLQRVSKTDDVYYGFELHRGDGNFNRVLCIGNGADGNGYGVSTSFKIGAEKHFESLGDENEAVNFFVVRIDFGQDDHDTATVYRNPISLQDESSCVATAKLQGMFAFDRVSLGNFEGSKLHEVDEVRIGTDFRAVTARNVASWSDSEDGGLADAGPNYWPLPLLSLR